MLATRVWLIFALIFIGERARAATSDEFASRLKPLTTRYCYDCHGDGEKSGEFAMDADASTADLVNDKARWDKAIQYARAHMMPPPDADAQPTPDERDALVASIQRILYKIDPAHPDPGRVTIRRLNVAEYRNTIRDLVGVNFDPTVDFPQDDTGYGFDNIGDVLSLPPMLLEKYLAAADKILDQAIVTDAIEPRERRIPATQASASRNISPSKDGSIRLTSNQEDSLSVPVQTKMPADFQLRVLAYAVADSPATRPTSMSATTQALGRYATGPIRVSLMCDNVVAKEIEISGDASNPEWIEARVNVPAGQHALTVAVRRVRGLKQDKRITDGHIGQEQRGAVNVSQIIVQGPANGAVQRFSGERLGASSAEDSQADAVELPTSGEEASATFQASESGDYLLRAQAFAEYAGDELARMQLVLDGKPVSAFEVDAPAAYKRPAHKPDLAAGAGRAVPAIYEAKVHLEPGEHRLAARFLNDAYFPQEPDENYQDRNLFVQALEVVDLSAPPCPPMPRKLRALFVKHAGPAAAVANAKLPDDPTAARAILGDFALHAWRRPPGNDELDRVMKLYELARDNGLSFHASVKHAMKGILISSSFLFRGEPQSSTSNSTGPELIGEYELASRLSYFLWSTMPDDELLDLAKRGKLRTNLDAEVKRMLASPKFAAFTDNFAGQWLQFRNLDASHPDAMLFPNYNDRMRDDMQTETRMFVESIMREDRSMFDLLTGDYTFVNEALANYYGIKGVSGREFRRVSLAGTHRRGILTQGSVLTLTSNPTRTSPVKRGKWVMENLLATAPPPPPPNIPPLIEPGHQITGTLRQQLEKHRADPVCASCHSAMDPIGLALENFDAVGAWRDRDNDGPIDASASLPGQPKFNGAVELAENLAKTRRNDFLRSIVEHMLTFALGRGVEPYDQPAVDQIISDMQKHDARFTVLINDVVESVPFQMRRSSAGASQ